MSKHCVCVCVCQMGRVPVLVFFFNPTANQSPGLLDGSTLAAVGNIVVVTANYRTAALGFLSTGPSGLRGNYGLSDQEAVLRWINAHIHLVGGDNQRVTVGAERHGADITSLHLLSSTLPPLFHRMMLMVRTLHHHCHRCHHHHPAVVVAVVVPLSLTTIEL